MTSPRKGKGLGGAGTTEVGERSRLRVVEGREVPFSVSYHEF
jgi:hypothetical protein